MNRIPEKNGNPQQELERQNLRINCHFLILIINTFYHRIIKVHVLNLVEIKAFLIISIFCDPSTVFKIQARCVNAYLYATQIGDSGRNFVPTKTNQLRE